MIDIFKSFTKMSEEIFNKHQILTKRAMPPLSAGY
jgi:hypothetical protein